MDEPIEMPFGDYVRPDNLVLDMGAERGSFFLGGRTCGGGEAAVYQITLVVTFSVRYYYYVQMGRLGPRGHRVS